MGAGARNKDKWPGRTNCKGQACEQGLGWTLNPRR